MKAKLPDLKTAFSKIPFLGIPDKPIIDNSWKIVPVADVVDDIVIFRDGGAAIVMESSSLNFSLLSEKEQEAVVAAYAALLNSLSFPIQILIKSQRKDISNYLKYLDTATSVQNNPKLTALKQSYKEFILNAVKKKNVLGKKFYVVIPFSPIELGVSKSFATAFKKDALPFPKSYVIKKAKIILYPKRDHLIRQSARLSIKLKQLDSTSLINLFYTIYNPEPPVVIREDERKEEDAKSFK